TGSAPSSFEPVHNNVWTLAPLSPRIAETGGVVDAASFSSNLAPGGLVSIFGAGLAASQVQVNGTPATVIAALPFQVNAQIPLDAAPGTASFKIITPGSSTQQSATISTVAPAIFSVAPQQAAITNVDNSLNTPANPAARGSYLVIYATGFGAVTQS